MISYLFFTLKEIGLHIKKFTLNNNNKKSFISTLQYKNVVNEETFLEYQKNYHNILSHLYLQTYKRRNTFCLVPKTTKANYTYSQNVLKANKKRRNKRKKTRIVICTTLLKYWNWKNIYRKSDLLHNRTRIIQRFFKKPKIRFFK